MASNISNAVTTDYSSITETSLGVASVDRAQDLEETRYQNDRFAKDYKAFLTIPKLQSAIFMKAIWTIGKGYTCDGRTKTILDRIDGDGKQTFKEIIFNMLVNAMVGRDSFAEIVRDEETRKILNLKILDPSTIVIVYKANGRIDRYEQINKVKTTKFSPDEIFHISHKKVMGNTHGISVPEVVENIILADYENFRIMRKLTRFQAVPFIMFKVKSDKASTIETFKQNIRDARESGEDLIIPDDENLLSWEVVQVNPSAILMEWRTSLNNEFYQAVGMPLILFGTAGSTESGGKIEYQGHETVWEKDITDLEDQIRVQLGVTIQINRPQSLLDNLQTDEAKDAQSSLQFQPNDVQAGSGE